MSPKVSVRCQTHVKKNSQIHKLLLTGNRIRDNISPSGVNKAGKTQSKLENFANVLHIFYHTVLNFSLPRVHDFNFRRV